MKILWITNILFPEALKLLTGEGDLKASGGWMLGAADSLIEQGVTLYVASVSPKVKKFTKLVGKHITYYVLPIGKGNQHVNLEYVPYWKQVNKDVKPDVVHIHGTEYSHGHAYMKAFSNENVVISIQGLTSAYYYYYYGISKREIYSNITFRDILKGNMIYGQNQFKKRAEYEIEMLRMTKHIIGRTSWDKYRTWAINPKAEYHFCNETLRSDFYDGSKWSYDKCKKHTIFLSQAGYPIKGLHQLLKAMPLILRHYPDTIVRIAGRDIIKTKSFIDKIRMTGYALYIKKIIKKYQLTDKIIFTGNLDAKEMKQEYLNANVFLCPSTIENSPNSLGEAQILGVPCVASYVGGIPDMMKGSEDFMYRFEEVEMLAGIITRCFSLGQINMNTTIGYAKERHNQIYNSKRTLEIYNLIIKK